MTARRWITTVNDKFCIGRRVYAQKPPVSICARSKFSEIFQVEAPSLKKK